MANIKRQKTETNAKYTFCTQDNKSYKKYFSDYTFVVIDIITQHSKKSRLLKHTQQYGCLRSSFTILKMARPLDGDNAVQQAVFYCGRKRS